MTSRVAARFIRRCSSVFDPSRVEPRHCFPLPLDAYDSSTEVLPEGYVPRSDREQNARALAVWGRITSRRWAPNSSPDAPSMNAIPKRRGAWR